MKTTKKRRLLASDDLVELFRVTNPKLNVKPRLNIVASNKGTSDWEVESTHILRGYNACQSHLETWVKKFEEAGLWPERRALGIGIFHGDSLVRVLVAVNLGYKKNRQEAATLPLDDMLSAIGLTRTSLNGRDKDAE